MRSFVIGLASFGLLMPIMGPVLPRRQEASPVPVRTAPVRVADIRSTQQPALRLEVSRDGLYRVRYEALRDAGVDLTGVPLADLGLLQGDTPVPIRVEGDSTFAPGAFIEFHGLARHTLYSDTNVYRLSVDRQHARRIATDDTPVDDQATPEAFYMATVTVDDNRLYSAGSPNGDPWYLDSILAYETPVTRTYEIAVDRYAPGIAPSTLYLDIWGSTDWLLEPDHHIIVQVNGATVAETRFDGLTDQPMHIDLPDGLLQPTTNTLTLVLPGDTGARYELVNLERFSITYPRRFVARDGQLVFEGSGAILRVEGLPSPEVVVYRLAEGQTTHLTEVEVDGSPGAYRATFPGTPQPATYVISDVDAILSPVLAPGRPHRDITSPPAEYLIVSHGDFIEGLAPLVQARQVQGFTVRVADVADIYAQFGDGTPNPAAIRSYVAYAAQHMGTRYVLLVGGDTYDYHNYLGRAARSFIPTPYRAMGLVTFAPADPLLADTNDDSVPDLPIGRLPVYSASQLETVIGKTLAYSAKDYGRTALFIADADEASVFYSGPSELMAAHLPAGWQVTRAYVEQDGLEAARRKLIDTLNAGVALTSFNGRSGWHVWTVDGLLHTRDVGAFTNAGRPTIVVQWCSWSNYFVAPEVDALGVQFLLSGDRGAAAVLGGTTLFEPAAVQLLGQHVMSRLARPGETIGAAVQAAKEEIAATQPGETAIMLGWTILGDPALVVDPLQTPTPSATPPPHYLIYLPRLDR